MGLDYRYLLFFEREARFDALEQLGRMAADDPDGPTTLVLPDRTATLPFPGWLETGDRLAWDDPSPTWDFTTALCFEPDEEVEAWVDRFRPPPDGDDDPLHDAQGRAIVGVVYLSVHNDMSNWPSGTGEDLVLFEFGTPGSSMSVLFWESTSIRRAFVHLLESCRGVYGLLDLEDVGADLVWLRGEERDDRLPTAEMPLAEVERFVATSRSIAFSFEADQVVAGARNARRQAGGADLGVHHWLLALAGTGRALPGPFAELSAVAAAGELRRRLDEGDIGAWLAEEYAREQAVGLARRDGRDLVTADDLARVVADMVDEDS